MVLNRIHPWSMGIRLKSELFFKTLVSGINRQLFVILYRQGNYLPEERCLLV